MSEDLISRQEAFYAVNKAFDRETLLTGLVRSIAVKAIRDVPSAEPVIIHCKDCKYYDGRPCGVVDYYNTESDFCSRAERRTDD